MENYNNQRTKKQFILFFLAIAALNFVVFYQSFFHTWRSDDFIHFLYHHRNPSVFSEMKNAPPSFKKPFVYGKSSNILFRPLAWSATLLLQRNAKTNYVLWHIISFIIHLLVLYFLLKIAVKINGSIFSYLLIAIFSCSFFASQMVIWLNTASYMLFYIFVLNALYYILCYKTKQNNIYLIYVSLSLLIACFFCEIGSIFTVIISIYAYSSNKKIEKKWLLLLLSPALIYLTVYGAIQISNASTATNLMKVSEIKDLFNFETISKSLLLTPVIMAWWLIVIAFPTVLSASLPNDIARLAFTIENQNFYSFAFFGNLIAVSIIAVFLCSCFSKNMAKNNRKQCFLLLAMILAYTYVILPGRLPTYGLNWTLTSFGYYTYVFLSLILIFIVSVCDFSRLKPFKRNILIIVLLVMLSININKTYNLCNYIKKITTEKRAYFDKLNSFVKKYSHDQDFSFAVTNDMFYVSKYPDVTLALPLSAIFYDQYINYKNPKYIVTMEGREVEQKEQDIYRK